MFPVRQWCVPFCYWQQSLVQVTVNVTKMVKHEDHESFSSPENLCLIEVTADSCGIKVTLEVLKSKKALIPIIYLKRRKTIPILYFSFPTQSPSLTRCPLSPWLRSSSPTSSSISSNVINTRKGRMCMRVTSVL